MGEDDAIMITVCAVVVLLLMEDGGKVPKRKRKVWVRPWLLERDDEKQCNTMLKLYRQFLAVGTGLRGCGRNPNKSMGNASKARRARAD